MRNPWARAKVGDWYIQRVRGARHLKIEVVRVSDVEVLVHVGEGEEPEDYLAYNLQDEERRYRAPEEIDGFVSKEEKTEKVGGKEIRVTVYTLESPEVRIVNTISDDVPLDGLIRSVRNGKVHHQVLDFEKY